MEDDVFVSIGQVGGNPNSVSYRPGGTVITNGGVTSTQSAYTDNDIIGIALDLDNGAVYFSKNGVFENSGDPTSGASRTGSFLLLLSIKQLLLYQQTLDLHLTQSHQVMLMLTATAILSMLFQVGTIL